MSSSFKQVKPYLPYIGIALLIVVVLCAMGVVPFSSRTTQGFDNPSDKFVMYYADWCPHCVTAKPEMKNLGSTQTIGGKTVSVAMIEEKDIPEAVKPKISGYPTIQLQGPDGSMKAEYSGDRTTAGFLQFLQQQYAQ
jgi:thiol-disulfide isomerase/thioredoxin